MAKRFSASLKRKVGLLYSEGAIDPGAQAERRGDARAVRHLA
jgi:hypothetical protein